MKLTLLAPIAALAAGTALATIAAPAAADAHMEKVAAPSIEDVLAHERRDGDRARDQHRNPAETLAFFQIEPNMTVAEFSPGGGWYTRVLAPYLMPAGQYIAFNNDSDGQTYRNRAQEARAKAWTENFKTGLAEAMDVEASDVMAFEVDEMPEDAAGTVDRVVIFRSMHGLNISNRADEVLKAAWMMLKPGGMVGVVQHRAPEGASYATYGMNQRGYMRQQDVIAIFEANGFELAAESDINANPNDPADWEGGVWTLPPVLRYGDQDRAKYEAIGESDRMTLLFKKVD